MSTSIEYQSLCHICQDYVDHFTRNCPTLICAECDEKGHAKRNCPYLDEPKKVSKEDQFPNSEKQNEISESDKVIRMKEKSKPNKASFRPRRIIGPDDLRHRINKDDARKRIHLLKKTHSENYICRSRRLSDDKNPDLQSAECEGNGHEITDCPYLKNT